MSRLSDYKLLSFDVYGTLIDWESGVVECLRPLLDRMQSQSLSRRQILETFGELEKAQQSKTPDMLYPEVLANVYAQFATKFGLDEPAKDESKKFGQSIGEWPAFQDTVDALQRLGKHYKLVVLSNVNRDSFAVTNAGPLKEINFDKIITAQDVGSYKPDPRNLEYMLKAIKEDFGVEKSQVLQTAQSQFHDHHPAREMGIKSVWIERNAIMGSHSQPIYDWKFLTLGEMADALEEDLARES